MKNPENSRDLGKFAVSLLGVEAYDFKTNSVVPAGEPDWKRLKAFERKYGIPKPDDYSSEAILSRRDAADRFYKMEQEIGIEERIKPTSLSAAILTFATFELHNPTHEAETSIFMAYEQEKLRLDPLKRDDAAYKLGFRMTLAENKPV